MIHGNISKNGLPYHSHPIYTIASSWGGGLFTVIGQKFNFKSRLLPEATYITHIIYTPEEEQFSSIGSGACHMTKQVRVWIPEHSIEAQNNLGNVGCHVICRMSHDRTGSCLDSRTLDRNTEQPGVCGVSRDM